MNPYPNERPDEMMNSSTSKIKVIVITKLKAGLVEKTSWGWGGGEGGLEGTTRCLEGTTRWGFRIIFQPWNPIGLTSPPSPRHPRLKNFTRLVYCVVLCIICIYVIIMCF